MHEHELKKNALVKGQVLIICTSCHTLGDRKDTGVWLCEVAVPYYIFRDKGYDVTLCSLAGGEIPVDQAGLTDAEKARHPELSRFLADGHLVAAVCHGLSGLLMVNDVDGKPLVAGKTIACFTQSEEEKTGASGSMPFQLESKLKELGANVRGAEDEENAVRDGILVTGQNHNCAARVAKLVLEALNVHPAGPGAPSVRLGTGAAMEACPPTVAVTGI